MMDVPSPLSATRDEAAELKALAQAVRLSRAFSLLLVRSPKVEGIPDLEKRLQALLADVPQTSLQLPPGVEHLLDELRRRLAGTSPRAVMVSGLERSIPRTPDAASSPLIGNLNAARNSFPAVIKCPLILWVTDYVVEAIAQGAPDFFSVRSGFYSFHAAEHPSAATIPEVVDALAEAAQAALRNGGPDAVRARYRELREGLLQAAGDLPDLRDALDALEARPDSLARRAMVREEIERSGSGELRIREAARLLSVGWPAAHAVNVGGGAIAQGANSIAAGAGAVVVHGNNTGPITVGTAVGPGEEPLRRAYLQRMFGECGRVWLAGVDRHLAADSDARLHLDAVYTALMTSTPLDPREAAAGRGRRSPGPEDLAQVDASRGASAVAHLDRHPCLVLLGDPGSGKSTFLNFVALCMAGEMLGDERANVRLLTARLSGDDDEPAKGKREKPPGEQPWGHGGLIPIRVVLRDFAAVENRRSGAAGSAEILWSFVQQELKRASLADFADHLRRALLKKSGAMLLLDGMDEVPEAGRQRQFIHECILDFKRSYPDCRILVTCRTYAYETPEWRLPDFSSAVLAPFDDVRVRAFVDRWYSHVGSLRGMQPSDARGKAEHLKHTLAASDRLQGLAERPLLLALICSLHAWRGGSLPEGREELYADAVDLLLEWWESQRIKRDENGREVVVLESVAEWLKTDRTKVRTMLEEIAFEIHRDAPSLVGTADIKKERLVAGLDAISQNPEVKPRRLVEYLSQRAGLLVPRGDGVFAFPHRTFQEYLAACHLTEDCFPELVADLASKDPDRWREVALLAAAKAARGTKAALWLLVEELLQSDPGRPERDEPLLEVADRDAWAALVAGDILVEALVAPLGARGVLAREPTNVAERVRGKLQKARRWLLGVMRQSGLPAAERARAGRALARLGDPRPGVLVPEDMELLPVKRGSFKMGDDPARSYEVAYDYEIGRYPVTQAQFQAFVEAGGYGDARWWGEAKAAGVWMDGFVKGGLDSEPRRGPYNFGEPFWLPSHPVVGVTWYEALAFCRWLTERMRAVGRLPDGHVIGLPNEPEWEKAARGTDGRTYPWEGRPDPNRANYDESGIGSTSAVGCFPGGASPAHAEEMAGNVWEWTRSVYGSLPYPVDEIGRRERENPAAPGDETRVLRGGSFNDGRDFARCACRNHGHPGNRHYFRVGFRVVSSPSSTPH